MMITRFRHHALRSGTALLFALLTTVGPAHAAGAEGIAEAKALYTAASYQEALAALGTTDTPEAHEYRGLCFLALGRQQDAERSVEALIAAAPKYTLNGEERPPRFVTLFTNTRKKVLPTVVRQRFAEARDSYQAKNFTRAKEQFELVLSLVDDPTLKDSPEIADLRLLAKGFGDLVAAAAPAPTPTPSADKPATAGAPAAGIVPPAAPTVEASKVVQPKTVRQAFPPVPSSIAASRKTLTGAVKVVIGTDGRVKSASIETSVHPQYDLPLLAAARSWLYTPATINGMPTEVERIVQVKVNAQ
jgi:hypothetical protein